jgi:hypothetical protein
MGNRFFMNIAASTFAEKHNLHIEYEESEWMQQLGIDLFIGKHVYNNTINVNIHNYLQLYENNVINHNVHFEDYFQSTKITDLTHLHIQSNMDKIVLKNKYKDRYNNNNNCFIHIRLGDVAQWNPGFDYYDGLLSKLQVDYIYIATDTTYHEIIHKLINKYSNAKLLNLYLIDIVLFASTNKHVILSHGTFSGMIGYLSFYSHVYFIKETHKTSWDYHGGIGFFDIFKGKSTQIGKFIEIDPENIII